MGEYVNASIKFGGKLPAEHAAELCELLNEKRLDPDWGNWPEVEPEDLRDNDFFGNPEVNFGNLDDLRAFAEEHGLHYEYECAAGPDWDGETIFYNPVTGKERRFVGENDQAVTLDQVKELGSYEAVLAFFDNSLPPFEIVGDFPPEEEEVADTAVVAAKSPSTPQQVG